jgi:hypothetical protein
VGNHSDPLRNPVDERATIYAYSSSQSSADVATKD